MKLIYRTVNFPIKRHFQLEIASEAIVFTYVLSLRKWAELPLPKNLIDQQLLGYFYLQLHGLKVKLSVD